MEKTIQDWIREQEENDETATMPEPECNGCPFEFDCYWNPFFLCQK